MLFKKFFAIPIELILATNKYKVRESTILRSRTLITPAEKIL